MLVVDEVGKMELFSSEFEPSLQQALKRKQSPALLATIPVHRGKPLPAVERLRSRSDVKVIFVSLLQFSLL